MQYYRTLLQTKQELKPNRACALKRVAKRFAEDQIALDSQTERKLKKVWSGDDSQAKVSLGKRQRAHLNLFTVL